MVSYFARYAQRPWPGGRHMQTTLSQQLPMYRRASEGSAQGIFIEAAPKGFIPGMPVVP